MSCMVYQCLMSLINEDIGQNGVGLAFLIGLSFVDLVFGVDGT